MSRNLTIEEVVSRFDVRTMPQSVRLSLFVLVVYIASLTPVELYGLSLIRGIAAFILLSFVPGFLYIDHIRSDIRSTDLLYAVGLSLAISMFVGWLVNLLYLNLPLWFKPFEEPNTSIIYVGSFSVLTGLTWIYSDYTPRATVIELMSGYDLRILLVLASVPTLAVAGALIINATGFNGVTLLTILLIGLVSVAIYFFDSTGKYYLFAIGAVSLSLILQNTVIMTHLGNGDGTAEYLIAKEVLQNGYWIPGAAKDAMPRIGVLHPVYSIMMDLNLLWEFKLIHPLLFALAPIITYKITSRYFSVNIAFLSSILYIFLPRTYQLLGRNTRTGSAILFTAFLLLILLDDELMPFNKYILAIISFWGIITSHYGIGPLVLFSLTIAYVLNLMTSVVFNNKNRSRISLEFVILCTVLLIAWYYYLTDGTFYFIINSIYKQLTGPVIATSQSTATRSASYGMPSLSYQFMYYSHLLLGVLTSLGLGLVYLRYLGHGITKLKRMNSTLSAILFPDLSKKAQLDSNYLHLSIGLFLFFPLSFGPNILSAGRTFGLVIVLLAPFPILLLRSERITEIGSKPALACLISILVITSGFVSATITHDVSPQPIIDGKRITDSGDTVEKFSFYRVTIPENSIKTSNFVLDHVPNESTLNRTSLGTFNPAFYGGNRDPVIKSSRLQREENTSQKFVYLTESDTVTGTNTIAFAGFVYYIYDPLYPYENMSLVYTAGKSKIHYASVD